MLIAYEIARELIASLVPLVVQIKREDHELADQLKSFCPHYVGR